MLDVAVLEVVRAILGMLVAAEQALLGLTLLMGALVPSGNANPRYAFILAVMFFCLSGDRWIISPVLGSDRTVLDVAPFYLLISCLWLAIAAVAGLFFIYFALRDFGTQLEGDNTALSTIKDTNSKVTDIHKKVSDLIDENGNGEKSG